jgi:hypothetical protein
MRNTPAVIGRASVPIEIMLAFRQVAGLHGRTAHVITRRLSPRRVSSVAGWPSELVGRCGGVRTDRSR